MDNQDPIQKLRDILTVQERHHEPWTSGIVNLSVFESTLFFKCKDGVSRSIELGVTTEVQTQSLIDACDPATFGRGPETVLDETYRKALRLEKENFSWLFNADSGKFIAQLARGFCPWDDFDKSIYAEPYKLNIYGKGGFFKNHQDTPRAENMFGSLVFVLPFEHQGGNLVLRHRTRDFNFNAPSLLREAPPSSVAYVAFYSDVEHEVLEVTAGHRVTITFNLYFDPFRAPPIVPEMKGKIPENPFITTLREFLRDPAFIRNHKYLGFGLEHNYPRKYKGRRNRENGENGERNEFDTGGHEKYECREYNGYNGGAKIWSRLEGYLKGPDAFLFKILAEAGFKPKLNFLFASQDSESGLWVMCDQMIQGRDLDEADHRTELDFLMKGEDRYIVWAPGKSEATANKNDHHWLESYFKKESLNAFRDSTLPVAWVTTPTSNLVARTEYTETGNEPSNEMYYFSVCIIVDIQAVPCPRLPV